MLLFGHSTCGTLSAPMGIVQHNNHSNKFGTYDAGVGPRRGLFRSLDCRGPFLDDVTPSTSGSEVGTVVPATGCRRRRPRTICPFDHGLLHAPDIPIHYLLADTFTHLRRLLLTGACLSALLVELAAPPALGTPNDEPGFLPLQLNSVGASCRKNLECRGQLEGVPEQRASGIHQRIGNNGLVQALPPATLTRGRTWPATVSPDHLGFAADVRSAGYPRSPG